MTTGSDRFRRWVVRYVASTDTRVAPAEEARVAALAVSSN